MKKLTVFLADDHAMVRMGLAALLGTKKDIQVIGEAESGRDAVRQVLSLKPDVVLMDLLMQNGNGVDATIEILRHRPETRILILTSAGSAFGISRALESGASGVILKSADFSTLVAAIRTIANGGLVIPPEIERTLAEDRPLVQLTSRQEEILASITRGFTNADIARQFGIQEQSVKEHIAQICAKIGASNRTEAVAIALRKHLLKI